MFDLNHSLLFQSLIGSLKTSEFYWMAHIDGACFNPL